MKLDTVPPPSILIVEDDRHCRGLVASVSLAMGFDPVLRSGSGQEGFAIFVDRQPDLVIVDNNMDPMDGIELIRWIRNQDASPAPLTPVIMMSAYTEVVHVMNARDAGVSEFVAKPLTATKIFTKIKNAVQNPRPFVKAAGYFGPDRRRGTDQPLEGPERRRVTPRTEDLPEDLRRRIGNSVERSGGVLW